MAHGDAEDPALGSGGGALGAVDRFVFRVEKFTAFLCGLSIFALMVLGVVHVLGRKFFNMPVEGYLDIVEIMMAFMVFLAIAYTERLGGHIRMELFVSKLKGRWLALFELVGVALGLALTAVLIVYSWDHAMRAYQLGDSSMDVQLPLWPSKIVVPISLGLLFVRFLISLWACLRVIVDPTKPLIGMPQPVDTREQALHEAAAVGALVEEPVRAGEPGGRR
jgi:C4-dicarboxylate transporter, DctQ subunit